MAKKIKIKTHSGAKKRFNISKNVTSTPVGMIRIIGVQARYFLPAFLMLTVLLAAVLSHVLAPRLAAGQKKPQAVALWTFAAFGMLGAVLLFQHYFIGPVFVLPG